jgi:hypothetical protein
MALSRALIRGSVAAPRAISACVLSPAVQRKSFEEDVSGSRFQSTAVQDPKTRANALIDALPGNSVVSKLVPPLPSASSFETLTFWQEPDW